MENLINNTLKNYFSLLAKTGYLNYNEVFKILVLLYIDKFIKNYPKVNDEEYRIINNAIHSLQRNSCIISCDRFNLQLTIVEDEGGGGESSSCLKVTVSDDTLYIENNNEIISVPILYLNDFTNVGISSDNLVITSCA